VVREGAHLEHMGVVGFPLHPSYVMLLFNWNVRGLNSPLKQHKLVRLMQKHKFDVCGLLETKLVPSKLQFMHRFRLKRWKLVSNVEAAGTARVVVL
jgi:exonuclease III